MTNGGRSLYLLNQQDLAFNVTEAGSEGQQINSLSRGDQWGRNKGCEPLSQQEAPGSRGERLPHK